MIGSGRGGDRYRLRCKTALLLSVLLAFGASPRPAAASPCTLDEVATLPASFKDGRISIDVGVNGTPAKFLIDTGSSVTWINRRLAERLHLPVVDLHRSVNTDFGTYTPNGVLVSELSIGRLAVHSSRFVTSDRGGDGMTDEFAGELAQEYLFQFDLEIDPAMGVINLFSPIHCPENAGYWSTDHFELPITTNDYREPIARITLDGHDFFARIDTGAAHSTIDIAVARNTLGVGDDVDVPLPNFITHDTGRQAAPNPVHTFNELVFGPITVKHPTLTFRRYRPVLAPVGTHLIKTRDTDYPVTIGMDILGKFHSLISYEIGKIYFTLPNERFPAPAGPPKP